ARQSASQENWPAIFEGWEGPISGLTLAGFASLMGRVEEHATVWPTEERIELSRRTSDEVACTTCYMCACRCGIKVHLKDGRIRYIEGNRDHPVNKGVLCAKGAAGLMNHYSPARLTTPLLRVGPRGSGKFKAIGWGEAMTIAVDWLSKIRARNPRELAFFTGRDQSQALTGWWAQRVGTPNHAAHGGVFSAEIGGAEPLR